MYPHSLIVEVLLPLLLLSLNEQGPFRFRDVFPSHLFVLLFDETPRNTSFHRHSFLCSIKKLFYVRFILLFSFLSLPFLLKCWCWSVWLLRTSIRKFSLEHPHDPFRPHPSFRHQVRWGSSLVQGNCTCSVCEDILIAFVLQIGYHLHQILLESPCLKGCTKLLTFSWP